MARTCTNFTVHGKTIRFEDDNELDVLFETYDSDNTHIRMSNNGRKAVVGYLSRDEDPANPRTEFDNVGTMVCWNRKYNLGDQRDNGSIEEFLDGLASDSEERWGDFCDRLDQQFDRAGSPARRAQLNARRDHLLGRILERNYVILPLYLHDYGTLTVSTGAFSVHHSSGQLGWIYADKKKVLEEWGGAGDKELCEPVREKAVNYLKGEVEEYSQYLEGDVYGVCYQCFVNNGTALNPQWEQAEPGETLSSGRSECWGYYGSNYAAKELQDGLKHYDDWLAPPPIPNLYQDQPLFGL